MTDNAAPIVSRASGPRQALRGCADIEKNSMCGAPMIYLDCCAAGPPLRDRRGYARGSKRRAAGRVKRVTVRNDNITEVVN